MLLYTPFNANYMKYSHEAVIAGILLLSVAATSAYAQGIQEVSGTYSNEDAGVEITFPGGWSGFEVAQTSDTTLVATSADGLSGDPETMATISLLITAKGVQDVNDPSSLTQDVVDCNAPSVSSRTVAGVQGTEVTVECPSTAQKFRMVAVETADNIVAVMFMAPTSDFDSNLAAFDGTVSSLSVDGATSSSGVPPTPTDEEPSTSMLAVMVGGEEIRVAVESTSTISDFALDEESKSVTFSTDGTGDASTVSVGSVLEGPYTVMVDGDVTTDFEESTDSQGVKTVSVTHGAGAHEVSISGTQVVPEFPIAALAAFAAIAGAVSVMGRTKLFRK